LAAGCSARRACTAARTVTSGIAERLLTVAEPMFPVEPVTRIVGTLPSHRAAALCGARG